MKYPFSVIPWNPVTTGTLPCDITSNISFSLVEIKVASPKFLLVITPACPPVIGKASMFLLLISDDITTELIISPQHIKRSAANLFSFIKFSLTKESKVSVAYGLPFLPIADTTTTGLYPLSIDSFTFAITFSLFSLVETDVPPNFCITIFKSLPPDFIA